MSLEYNFDKESFLLLPEKALFWKNENTLIIADLHLGKASHFRKQGLAIPAKSTEKDYHILNSLIAGYKPSRLLILGDLFHSEYNNEWEVFANFISKNTEVKFELVLGNHDILPVDHYNSIELYVHGESLVQNQLIFTHHPLQSIPQNFLNISGHIHPGVRLQGIGRQSVTLPCFYKIDSNFILPAFGNLTGLKILNKQVNTDIFGISGSKIFKI